MFAAGSRLRSTPPASTDDIARREIARQARGGGSVAASECGVRTNRWWRELLLVWVLYEIYNAIQSRLTGSAAKAQHDGWDVLAWERRLHLDPELALNHVFSHVAVLAVPACYFYASLHFIITPAVLLWTHRARRGAYRQARSVLFLMTLGGLVGFWCFPTAPPRLLQGAGFSDTVARFSGWGWWSSDVMPAAAKDIANQYAAMPSLHVAWAVWCAATVCTLTRRPIVRAVAVAYPILTTIVVLATANHYLLDVLAGIVLWFVASTLVGGLAAWRVSARAADGQRERTRVLSSRR